MVTHQILSMHTVPFFFFSHAGNKLIIILKLPPKPNRHFLEEHAVVGEIPLYNRALCPPTAAEVPLEVHQFYLIFPQKKKIFLCKENFSQFIR